MAAAARQAGRDPASVRLVAVTKYGPPQLLAELLAAGQLDLAENRVQQLVPRAEASVSLAQRQGWPVPCWHMIGTLQRNKVKQLIGHVAWVHSLDTLALAQDLDRRHGELRAVMPQVPPLRALVQVSVSGEASKQGVSTEEAEALVDACRAFPHLCLAGLMTMAPLVAEGEDAQAAARPVFAGLRQLRDELRHRCSLESLTELSMGMTGDYEVAIAEGATMVRVGSALLPN